MKAFLGTTLGKVFIGILAAAVVAGGGYGIYRAVQSEPVPVPEITTDEATTTEAPITTEAETTAEEEITEAPTEAPTAAPTAAQTDAPTTAKATTTKPAVNTIELTSIWDKSMDSIAKSLGLKLDWADTDTGYEPDIYYYKHGQSDVTAEKNDYVERADYLSIRWTTSTISVFGLTVGDSFSDYDVAKQLGQYGKKYVRTTAENNPIGAGVVHHYYFGNDGRDSNSTYLVKHNIKSVLIRGYVFARQQHIGLVYPRCSLYRGQRNRVL